MFNKVCFKFLIIAIIVTQRSVNLQVRIDRANKIKKKKKKLT